MRGCEGRGGEPCPQPRVRGKFETFAIQIRHPEVDASGDGSPFEERCGGKGRQRGREGERRKKVRKVGGGKESEIYGGRE